MAGDAYADKLYDSKEAGLKNALPAGETLPIQSVLQKYNTKETVRHTTLR